MTLRTVILAILTAYVLGFFAHALAVGKVVYGDGRYYYAWMHTLASDQDLDFSNEYRELSINEPKTAAGIPANKYSIGTGIFWIPMYVFIHSAFPGSSWTSFQFQSIIGLTSVFAAIAGLVCMLWYLHASAYVTSLTLLLIAGATNLAFYGSLDPLNSHAVSFFYASVFVAIISSRRFSSFFAGVMLGLLATVRMQDIVYALLLFPVIRRRNFLHIMAGFALAFTMQLVVWHRMYGSIVNPYLTGGEGFHLFSMNIFGVLFHAENGLILWTPIIAIGFIGLVFKRNIYKPHILVCVIQLLIVSSWSTWWQGASYSGRMFVSTLPLIAIGISTLLKQIHLPAYSRRSLWYLSFALCFLNLMLMFLYLRSH